MRNHLLAAAVAVFLEVIPTALAASPHLPSPPPRDFPSRCIDAFSQVGHVQIRSNWDPVLGSCVISVDPDNAYLLVYRSYLFTETGLLMVFNSFGEGPESATTGARDFYFYPRAMMPAFRYRESTGLEVRLASGAVVSINTDTARLRGISTGEIQEDPEIRKDNRGGVEIELKKGLLLDAGFSMGHAPEGNLSERSEFRDPVGQSCSVANSEIFTVDGTGDIHSRFETDELLHSFLAGRCPGLSIDLEPDAARNGHCSR